ncbi:MAG: hypothetical protein PSV16_01890 [Flavobacterium sp.]|nr:hypothetical protein [Flavobacterium sp.]
MKLTRENIQFIDHYLRKSDVFYADIRTEMIDHVASAVETKMKRDNLDFYDAFRNYMAVNKNEILKGNRRYVSFNFSVLKRFGKFLIQPKMFPLALAFFIFAYLSFDKINVDFWLDEFHLLPCSVFIVIMAVQLIYTRLVMKKRFYYLERTSLIPMIVNYTQFMLVGRDFIEMNIFATYFLLYILAAYVIYFCSEIYVFKKSMKLFYAQ